MSRYASTDCGCPHLAIIQGFDNQIQHLLGLAKVPGVWCCKMNFLHKHSKTMHDKLSDWVTLLLPDVDNNLCMHVSSLLLA